MDYETTGLRTTDNGQKDEGTFKTVPVSCRPVVPLSSVVRSLVVRDSSLLYESLCDKLLSYTEGGIAIAFSGGVDSTLILAVLRDLREQKEFPLEALTMHSVLNRDIELTEVKRIAETWNIPLRCFTFDPFSIPEIRHNAKERCYACKHAIFTQFKDYATAHNLHTLIDGTNANDLHVYRPGRRALQELGVISPLADLGFTKNDIRTLAKDLGLSIASKPASPCLATRFPYNTELTADLLAKVAEGEDILCHYLGGLGETALPNPNVRLRVHGTLARIEVDPDCFPVLIRHRDAITSALNRLGFASVTLDLNGFRSGSMDMYR